MKKTFFLLLLTLGLSTQAFNKKSNNPISNLVLKIELLANKFSISKEAIQHAFNAYEKLKLSGQLLNQQYLTIADFSKPSSEKRLFIIDINKMELVLQTLVAHGRNSGTLFAKNFSNTNESYQSSLGFYITGNIYRGKHGMSLQLSGIESGINDHAKQRAIVIHGADYVSNNLIKKQGYIGRSLGCPAVPQNEVKEIIQTIKGASLLYIYAPSNYYSKKSKLINEPSLIS
ncbi:murein L,D-transpeptidase catalytic domain family protein [Sediminibacterium sp.]|uniref:murein L,D-transpeptidase catalytic domain family protein n=1 Tax=Sediminibacterium sp. TaxID=1917865 RepID=UPI002735CF4E|nr:murein L,D-transpeptidase catalytic domain family protein [Sediminibacterium sp.]MDP3394744.1 murein L,D-transpeptidase catalytic domain family protein [Sediminibacterium sp.]MDP3568579.1 murein L,D-transpeptidase catalytic domain family protein [Sediminibacterium sp.]